MTGKSVVIIAEAGVNHNGDIMLAKRLIDAAANAGADYVKFQTWITEELIDKDAPKAAYQEANDDSATQFDMLKKLELSFGQFRELKNYAEKAGVKFLSTPDEEKSLDFLVNELGLDLIKIGSGEVTNVPYLRKVGSMKKKVILSTGMSYLDEVRIAYDTLIEAGASSVSLLHCTSNYPASFDSLNLHAMNALATTFPNAVIGYSDHSEGTEASIAAVALGARIIEKHFTLDKNMPGPDHKASLDTEELALLVKQVRNIEKALAGSGKKEPHACEHDTRKVVTKGIYLKQNVRAGEAVLEENIITKRPVKGIPANEFFKVAGRKVKRDIAAGEHIQWNDLLNEQE